MSHGPLVRAENIGTARPVDVLLGPLRRFMRFEAAGGIVLLLASVAALAWANSSYGDGYHRLWHETRMTFGFAGFQIAWTLGHWINELLMAVFFLVVGMEIKRELLIGELASVRRAAVPVIAAIGGMAVPGAIYAAVNWGTPQVRGWGIPMATDIAFAVGALAILGSRVPLGLRVFLVSLAIIDDLGALIVIAVFYTDGLQLGYLGAAGGVALILIMHNMLGVRRAHAYVLWGLVLWYLVYMSGVHATIAGVVLAATIPARTRIDGAGFIRGIRTLTADFDRTNLHDGDVVTNSGQQGVIKSMELYCEGVQTPLHRLEHALLPWTAFLIVPLFALANAGVVLSVGIGGGGGAAMLTSPVSLGIVAGLVLGKPTGILLATWLAVRIGLGELPRGVTWRHLLGAGFLGGIGFTMSLFIAALAFEDPEQLNAAKAAVLAGSVVAGLAGFAVLWTGPRRAQADSD